MAAAASAEATTLGLAAWTAHLLKRHPFIESSFPTKVAYEAWLASAASAAVAEAAPSGRALALPEAQEGPAAAAPDSPALALPAPEDVRRLITLDVSSGEAIVLDQFGPVVVNSDGTLSRITNWETMTDGEKETAKRLIAKRNGVYCSLRRPPSPHAAQRNHACTRQLSQTTCPSAPPPAPHAVRRMRGFRDAGTLKSSLMRALGDSSLEQESASTTTSPLAVGTRD